MRIEDLINKNYRSLSDIDLIIAEYILNNKSRIPNFTLRYLAEQCNSSKSTVLRFTKKLGFSGFSEFKYLLKWDKPTESKSISYVDSLIEDINANLNHIKQLDFNSISKTLYSADRIFAYGTGTEQQFCATELKRYFWGLNKFINIINDEKDFITLLPNLTKTDVVIIISLSGQTPSLQPIAKQLVAKNIPFISVTNMRNNDLAQLTKLNVYAATRSFQGKTESEITTFSTFFIACEAIYRHYLEFLDKG